MKKGTKRLLCILELENTVLMTKPIQEIDKKFNDQTDIMKPSFTKDGTNVFFRRGREEFLNNFFKKVGSLLTSKPSPMYDFAVWTSLDRQLAELTSRAYLGAYYQR